MYVPQKPIVQEWVQLSDGWCAYSDDHLLVLVITHHWTYMRNWNAINRSIIVPQEKANHKEKVRFIEICKELKCYHCQRWDANGCNKFVICNHKNYWGFMKSHVQHVKVGSNGRCQPKASTLYVAHCQPNLVCLWDPVPNSICTKTISKTQTRSFFFW